MRRWLVCAQGPGRNTVGKADQISGMAQDRNWLVDGVRPECREAAKIAARRAGLSLGDWLNRTIMNTVRDELGAGKERQSHQLPALPMADLVKAIEMLATEVKEQNRRTTEQVEQRSRELAERAFEPVAVSVANLERNLDDKLGKLDGLDDVAAVVGRVREMEGKADKASLAVAPLERTVLRMAERLDQLDGGLHPRNHPRPGFFARLFGRE